MFFPCGILQPRINITATGTKQTFPTTRKIGSVLFEPTAQLLVLAAAADLFGHAGFPHRRLS